MKELNANGLYLSIAQALQKMEEEQGNSFSLEQVNLAELERLTGISRGKLRRLKKNGFQEVAHANKGVKHQKTKDGTINFDTSSALDAGYNEAAVTGIANHLNNINERVLAGEMIVDDTFTAYSIVVVKHFCNMIG